MEKEISLANMSIVDVIKLKVIPFISFEKNVILFNNQITSLLDLKNHISRIMLKDKLNYVTSNLDTPKMEEKIISFLESKGMSDLYTIDDIKSEITNNSLFAANFIKDLGRQNVYENLQFAILKKYGKNIVNLPTSGNKAKFVYESKITNEAPKTEQSTVKSIDFIESYSGFSIIYFCKFTKEIGGSQDNQKNDAILFLEEANKYIMNNNDMNRFVFLGDGAYYQTDKFKSSVYHLINKKVKIHTIESILTENWSED